MMAKQFLSCLVMIIAFFVLTASHANENNLIPRYVGSESCRQCHLNEYESFVTYAKKSRSFRSIERLRKGLNDNDLRKCYACHTTGYGKPGGFISIEKNPQLKNAGCEVCHGPGEFHLNNADAFSIKRKMSMKDCEECHTSERVRAFRYKPLIHGGAH